MNREEMMKYLDDGISPLEVAIMKWIQKRDADFQKVSEGEYGEKGSDTCSLCYMTETCADCIIYKHTDFVSCLNTPYDDYIINPNKYNASRMVVFLKSLRKN